MYYLFHFLRYTVIDTQTDNLFLTKETTLLNKVFFSFLHKDRNVKFSSILKRCQCIETMLLYYAIPGILYKEGALMAKLVMLIIIHWFFKNIIRNVAVKPSDLSR